MAKTTPPANSDKAPAHGPRDEGKNAALGDRDRQKSGAVENDRAASKQSGVGSRASQRDMTSGKQSGNQ